jgi:spore maturation protein CgeB
MKIALFCHSLLSDWNHGNAHFLRGVVTELAERGFEVVVHEPRRGWSLQNLLSQHGRAPVHRLRRRYPRLRCERYGDPARLDLERLLDGVSLALVHEWSDPALVRRLGQYRARRRDGFRLLFHDTHHRSVSDPEGLGAHALRDYDGVLAFGEVIRQIYLERGWAGRCFTWHEAADVRVFGPAVGAPEPALDLAWVGNWGDGERTRELEEFLVEPAAGLGLRGVVHGVRYPEQAIRSLRAAGLDYRGWLPNFEVPEVFARARLTVHVPRRPYVERLPGIPTIRVFEALACGIPLVCAPWNDCEGLFVPGRDYWVAPDGRAMRARLRQLLAEPGQARALGEAGRATVLSRHTCAHRVDELLDIVEELGLPAKRPPRPSLLAARA